MKQLLQTLAFATLITVGAQASEHETATKEHKDFYVAAKALVTLGDEVKHEESTLDGGVGKGVGVDIGYRVSHNFAVEIDMTYANSDVTEIDAQGEKEDVTGKYITSSLDVVYMYHAMHDLGLFVKGGIEYEVENIDALDIEQTEVGVIYALGGEYEISHHSALILEYEGSTIEGPRGSTVLAGMVYSF